MPENSDLAAWLRLTSTPGVGPIAARRLLQAFGLPADILAATHGDVAGVTGLPLADALLRPCDAFLRELESLVLRTAAWAALPGNLVLTLADTGYPSRLLEIPDPPVLLYVKGRAGLLDDGGVAIVGSRNATEQGLLNARRFAHALCRAGRTVVSGLALGIDTAAHEGSLEAAGFADAAGGANPEAFSGPAAASGCNSSTVAVIGTGIDIVYPARNRDLAHRIAAHGCLVSEYPLGTPALSANFPRRNRIISGLAEGVLVVEAAARSGSLITARLALEQGRDVFAIPGSIHSALAKGCHQLIRQGAKLVESAEDVLEELPRRATASGAASPACAGSAAGTTGKAPPDAPARRLLQAMGFEPVGRDGLAGRAGLDAATIDTLLLALELDGNIERLPGGLYQRIS